MTGATYKIYYFPVRGRGEVIKLAIAAAGQKHEIVAPEGMKSDLDKFPFGQGPTMEDPESGLVIAQSAAIVRFLARKYNMYGSSNLEAAYIDAVLEGVEDLKKKYLALVYSSSLSDEAKTAYWAAHVDPASIAERNGGAHFAYLAKLQEKTGKGGYMVGDKLSIADLFMYELTDLQLRIWGDKFAALYPTLAKNAKLVEAVPGIKAYITSEQRLEKVNGNGLG